MIDNLFNPDYLKSLSQKYGLRPSRDYGQNFLIDESVIEKMLLAGEVNKNDTVVEVGPGFGVLTFPLLEKAKNVIAFEIEKKLQPYWDGKNLPNLEIIWGNALREVLSYKLQVASYKVIANLPYQITSNIIRKFLEMENPPSLMVFMVQKEVGERICAKPGEMSLLSVAVQYYAEPEIIAFVPRTSFWPEPKVDSAIVRFRIKQQVVSSKDGEFERRFFKVVKAGFAQKRKLLIKNLAGVFGKEKTSAAFQKLGFPPQIRAQELTLKQWQELSTLLS